MNTLQPTFDYKPREQFLDYHHRKERFALIEVHRRGGKTFAAVADMILRALYTEQENARYAYIAPFRTQAKEIAWGYLKMLTNGLRSESPRESDLRVRLYNGAWITLYGADNPDALRGIYLDGATLDEYDDMKPSLRGEIIMPTLLDRMGWLTILGTIKGRGNIYQLRQKVRDDPNWFYKYLPASRSGLLSDAQLEEARKEMSPDEWRQEMELDADAALKGSYYTELMNDLEERGQICDHTLFTPDQKVHVAADIGYSDTCSWWFWQPRPDGFALVDYYEADGKKLHHYLAMLAEKDYEYEEIWLPHDARAKTLQTGRSTIEQMMNPSQVCPEFYDEGDKLPLRIVPRMAVQHGIEAVRMILPMCWFDRERCNKGIDGLRNYQRRWNENTKTFDDKPQHNWASHPSDAFRMFAMVAKGSKGQSAEALARPRKPKRKPAGALQYKDGKIWTVDTLDQIAPLGDRKISIGRARRI